MNKLKKLLFIVVISLIGFLSVNIKVEAKTITCSESTFNVDEGKNKIIGVKANGINIKELSVKSSNNKNAKVKIVEKNGKYYVQVTGKKKTPNNKKIKITIKNGNTSTKCNLIVNKKNTQTKEENEAESITNEGITDISQSFNNTGITSSNTAVKTIKCPSKTPTVEVGKTKKINYKVNPSDANTDNINVIVKGGSKDNIKITSKSPLKVKGIKKGTGKIVFKYNGKTTTCKIKVEKGTTSSKKTSTKSTNNNAVKTVTITGSKTINKGETKTYIANVSPSKANGKVTWKSSNTKIATISSNGQLTAKKTGTVTITATSKENSKIKGTKKITINKKEIKLETGSIVKVESISIPSSKSITVDGKSKLKVTYIPENSSNSEIIWKTSDKKIVTVDSNGTVVGHKVGTAIVTATSKDNKNATSKCKVIVGKKVNVEKVNLDYKKITIVRSTTAMLNATVLPKEVSNKTVTWKSSNKKIATISSNGQVTGLKTGKVTITATSISDATKKASITLEVVNIDKGETNIVSKKKLKSFTFDTYEVNLISGNSKKIKVTKNPTKSNDIILWKTSNEKIATVDSKGKITGYKAGEAVVTGYAQSDSNIQHRIKVNVSKKEDGTEVKKPNSKVYPAPNIKVEKEYSTLYNGEPTTNFIFKYNIKGATKLEWENLYLPLTAYGNEENGYLLFNEALNQYCKLPKSGNDCGYNVRMYFRYTEKVSIRVTAYYKDGKSKPKILTLKVKRNEDLPELKIKLNKKKITFDSVNEKYKLKVTLPKEYRDWFHLGRIYSSSDESVATVNQKGVIESKGPGEAIITVKVGIKKATCKIIVKDNQTSNNSNNNITSSKWQTDENNYNSTILKIGEKISLPYLEDSSFIPSNYTYVLTDSSVISIDETGKITALNAGTTYIKLISKLDGSQYGELLKIMIENE